MKAILPPLLLLMAAASHAADAGTVGPESLQSVGFLSGEWRSTAPGPATGDSFKFELSGHVLLRTSLHDASAAKDGGGGAMTSMMTIYPDPAGKLRAIYFDSEGHVISYQAATLEAGKLVQFVSDGTEPGPKFRLTYQLLDSKTLHAKFEFAMPSQPQDFHVVAEGDEALLH